MLGGSYVGYAKATRRWWAPIAARLRELDLHDRPVYFVSSNTHALVNLLSAAAWHAIAARIERFIERIGDPCSCRELRRMQRGREQGQPAELALLRGAQVLQRRARTGARWRRSAGRTRRERGIYHVGAHEGLPVDTQIIDWQAAPRRFRPAAGRTPSLDRLRESQAVILNIDYPLGLAAYYIFVQIAESLEDFRGIYITGKAATLNGRVGDVMIADSVYRRAFAEYLLAEQLLHAPPTSAPTWSSARCSTTRRR